jgi:hypothetical protein
MAGRAGAALLAGEGDEHLVVAVGAADPGEAFVQVAALQEGLYAMLDDRTPESEDLQSGHTQQCSLADEAQAIVEALRGILGAY